MKTLLIANRGEIAVRVMRTAGAMGLKTVAVYSDADANAPHVKAADQAVRIGAAPVGESYLKADAILAAAAESGADAIHPGYGFLSENADFAEAVAAAGLTFVGPPADAIRVMGDKAGAKRAMIDAGVPCVPGYQGEDQSDDRLIAEAGAVGFPIMVKAAAGGGGRGMRLVAEPDALPQAIRLARSEAENAFGSGELILERAIQRPRHVEVQVFADAHGGCVHLGERDCSVQRRHQKVLEEAPCPVMTPELRAEMGAAAVAAARAVDYRGAGTVEFLLDDHGFYFLEMNTRLQVEHPVTEEVTGLDLVRLQLDVAMGRPLGFAQEDVTLTGWSIEARLYAETPEKKFLPSTGPIRLWAPAGGEGVRIDAGIETGGEVSPFYDPMVAKVIATGATRDEARRRLIGALENTALIGPRTNRAFLADALGREAFAAGEATTAFIEETYPDGFPKPAASTEEIALAAAILFERSRQASASAALIVADELMNWSSAAPLGTPFSFEIGDEIVTAILRAGPGGLSATIGEEVVEITALSVEETTATAVIAGQRVAGAYVATDDALHLALPTQDLTLKRHRPEAGADAGAGGGRVTAPMHGVLLDILVEAGAKVSAGDRLAILEAMKMQHEIIAAADGTVAAIGAEKGAQIAAGDLIMEIET